ncbi:Actin-binding Rho-activating protein [Mytilus coruscus]|uniref:Actin-binding Rho-activating protein n=1 Tax=Mytilus coruscus TaxID=42192 RepID=A0A6J8A9Z0_MYTCO|nr:Actin-binding Rho-activating protein [Mytilus coruscus]
MEQEMDEQPLTNRVQMWQKRADEHKEKQLVNPFSDWEGASHRQKLSKDDENYGRPVSGSKTESRGKLAGEQSSREVIDLCYVINDLGKHQEDGSVNITFGELFEAYLTISNKLVGTLIRARKYKFVEFEGEMLYQGRDEEKVMTLRTLPERP